MNYYLQTTKWSLGKRLSAYQVPVSPSSPAATAKLADGWLMLLAFKKVSCTQPPPAVTGNGFASWQKHANTAAQAINSRTRMSSNASAIFATALKMLTSEPQCRDTSLPHAVLNAPSGSATFMLPPPPATPRQLLSSRQSKRPPVTGATLLHNQEASLKPFRMSKAIFNTCGYPKRRLRTTHCHTANTHGQQCPAPHHC